MADLFKTPTAGVGANGLPIYDVFEGERKLELPEFQQRGLNIDQIAVGQAPTGFTSQFGKITPESLTGTNPLPIANPAIPPVPTIPDMVATPQEDAQSAEIAKIREQNSLLLGKSAYQNEQETKFGVDQAQANINDLTAQLQAIKNEAAAIPLQLQQQAQGKAITNSVLGAQENARLRTNTIAALGVSTLLAASQGQLANAQAMADRAVEAKFGPIEAERDALIQNLELIKLDPQTTLQEKNRADKQIAAQEKLKEADAQRKADYANIQKVAIEAAANSANFTPTSKYKTVTQALDAIRKEADPVKAVQIAVEAGLVEAGSIPASAEEYEYAKSQGYTGSFLDYQKLKATQFGTEGPDGPIDLSTADKTALLGAGFTSSEVSQIQNDVNQFGLDAVLEGLNDNQKKAIQDVYGVKEKVTRQQVEATVTQKVAQDGLKNAYTPEELIEFAKEAGFASFWRSRDAEVKNYLNSDAARQKYIDLLYEQYKAAGMAQDFKGVGGDTNSATVDKIANTIAILESKGSGDYKAVGPQTNTGDRAYGKYQIMGANIAQWSKEALGKAVSVAQFMANPQLQDQIAKFKMNQYLTKFKDPAKVAAAWFAGPAGVNKLNAKDVLGTSVGQYVAKFNKNFS